MSPFPCVVYTSAVFLLAGIRLGEIFGEIVCDGLAPTVDFESMLELQLKQLRVSSRRTLKGRWKTTR